MKRSVPSPEDQVRSIHYKYDISEERVKAALDGHRFGEVDEAALLSCLSGRPMEDILEMRKDFPWGVIRKKLNFTAESYEKAYFHHRAERLHRFYGVETERALSLLEEHTGKKMEDIVNERKKSEKWKPWAERVLGVSPDDFTKWIAETRNPSLPVKK